MRVLYLCHSHADVTIGGVAEFLRFLPIALKAHDIDVIIYTQSKESEINSIGNPSLLPNGILHYSGPFLKPRWYISKNELHPVLELCKKENIELIHAQGTYRAGYLARIIQKKLKIPYIITSHSDVIATNSKRIKRRRVRNRCKENLRDAAHVTHLTPLMANHSHAIHDTSNKSSVIHNGIDTSLWKSFQNLPEQNYLLAVGRLEPEKGFSILLNAFSQLQKQSIHTSLVIAGTGSAELSLHNEAIALGLNVVILSNSDAPIPPNSVVFTGYVRGNWKNQLFSHANLVLFPTQPQHWEEAFSIVQLEAIAAGKAIISSDIPSSRYLQNLGQQSELVQANDASQWATAILTLLKDNALRQAMGKQNQQLAQKFDWHIIAKEYADVYKRVISN